MDVFQAIADPTRREILRLLALGGEQPVAQIAQRFAVTLPAVSQHLRVLRAARLVQVRQSGRERLYRLNADPLREVAVWTRTYEAFWDDKLAALGRHLDDEAGKEASKNEETTP